MIRHLYRLSLVIFCLGLGQGCSRDELSDAPPPIPKVVQSILLSPAEETSTAKGNPESEDPAIEKNEGSSLPVGQGKEIQTAKVHLKKAVDGEEPANTPDDGSGESIYTIKPGDNLARIAGRDDVCGDPLKWPVLYRLNYEQLDHFADAENLPSRELPQGMSLNIISQEQRRKNLAERKDRFWVVNIVSSTSEENITRQTARLIVKGYPVYISRALIKGREWRRVRIGFFKTRNEADELGRDIMSGLGLTDAWSTKIGIGEFREFAGY